MPATEFICPSGSKIAITDCLSHCPNSQRCMFLPTLRCIADSTDRKLDKPSVTELINGVRETYLRHKTNYAVDPSQQVFSMHGTAFHALNENHTDGNMLSEERIANSVTSGKFDLYGEIMDANDQTLGDFKVTSSYKLMKALGYYKVDVLTGEVYKTGAKKGQPKTRKEWRTDGVKHVLEWAIQLNYYRILLEENGFKVNRMVIQAMCRDFGLRMASERNIRHPVYLIEINRISDHWIKLYMRSKAKKLQQALADSTLPQLCNTRERWHNRKCLDYCDVAESCPFGRKMKLMSTFAA